MSKALEGLSALPWGVHAAIALAMAAGIVLWLCGRRVLKPLLVTLAILFGAAAGLILPGTSWGASLSTLQGLGIGAVVGLMLGLLLYRSAMAMACGVVLGAALPLIAATVLQIHPIAGTSESQSAAASHGSFTRTAGLTKPAQASTSAANLPAIGGLQALAGTWMDDGDMSTIAAKVDHRTLLAGFGHQDVELNTDLAKTEIPSNLRPAADRLGEAWSTGSSRARDEWNSMPASHRAIVGLSGVIGLAGGVVSGLVMPVWAGGAVTSLFGAAIWLPCFVWLSNAMSAPWRAFLDRSPGTWLIVWAATALVGMIFQWRSARKSRRAAANAAPALA